MDSSHKLHPFGHPVAELPVADVERAQQHYKDTLGFDIGWIEADKGMGAVTRGGIAIFFRKKTPPFAPTVHWIFAEHIDETYEALKSSAANIVDPLMRKPWGLRQFTISDLDGNLFHFHQG
jgi:predicted enzyme related to lactoylglutathione lyase